MHPQQALDNFDFMNLVRLHPDSILLVDEDNKVIFANAVGLRLLCRLPASHDYLPACLDFPYDTEQVISVIDIAGHEIILNIQCQHVPWKGSRVRLFCLTDVTGETLERRALEKLVYTDHLTSLYNRRGIEQLAVNIISSAKRHDQYVSLFYIDVNKLKQINDTLGHAAGDAAIVETADILRNVFRECDVIARIGGDEFAVLVTEDDMNTNNAILQRLLNRIRGKNSAANRSYKLSLSIGIVQYEHNNIFSFRNLLEKADRQMYVAKHGNKWNLAHNYYNTDEEAITAIQPRVLLTNKPVSGMAKLTG